MPDDNALDEMALRIANCNFNELTAPEHKARIMELAILASISYDTGEIASWFNKSRLWEGH